MSLDRRLQKLEESAAQAGLDKPPRETWGPLMTYCALELMGLAVWDEVKGYWSPTPDGEKRDWLKQRVTVASGEAIPDADAERVRYEWTETIQLKF